MIRLKLYTKNRLLLFLLIVFISGIATNSCEKVKTYEEGPGFSLRSKKSRITGEWKLESYKIGGEKNKLTEDSLQNMRMILKKEKLSDNKYKAEFFSFKEEYCRNSDSKVNYFSANGYWEFYDGAYGGCNIDEYLESKEGILLKINVDSISNFNVGHGYKILRLTNKELKIKTVECVEHCWYDAGWSIRELLFRKNK